jgi:sugar phosphate permease
MLLSLGIGFLYHALVPSTQPVRNLAIALLVCAITYAIIPFAIDNGFNNISAILLLMSVNGFVQSFTWSNLLVIVNSRWDKSRNSTALGFWATNANVGNILGFAICEEVHKLHLPWEEEMYCTAALTFIIGILVFCRIKEI